MPLARYEIRNEYSLANPDLYRAAAKDDPEGLLEGVAMAGLVGIVRQLGDLAEFAAEVFHDLHEEILATAARGHGLMLRVQQLEAELPFLEKMMLGQSNGYHGNFAYNSGVGWHAVIHNDQNHFTQGDLPRFIRNAYEECRSPPRLFLLDKFDVAGAGACLKRYTDPSFFKMEWASSELMKAEKEQQDKRARRIKEKKKIKRQRNGEKESGFGQQLQASKHLPESDIKNLETENIEPPKSDSGPDPEVFDPLPNENIQPDATKGPSVFEHVYQRNVTNLDVPEEGARSSVAMSESPKFDNVPINSEAVMNQNKTVSEDYKLNKETMSSNIKDLEDGTDDVASEAENFLDALTTMDSEAETDTEVKIKSVREFILEEISTNSSCSENINKSVKASEDEETTVYMESKIDGKNPPYVASSSITSEHMHTNISPNSEHVNKPSSSELFDDEHVSSQQNIVQDNMLEEAVKHEVPMDNSEVTDRNVDIGHPNEVDPICNEDVAGMSTLDESIHLTEEKDSGEGDSEAVPQVSKNINLIEDEILEQTGNSEETECEDTFVVERVQENIILKETTEDIGDTEQESVDQPGASFMIPEIQAMRSDSEDHLDSEITAHIDEITVQNENLDTGDLKTYDQQYPNSSNPMTCNGSLEEIPGQFTSSTYATEDRYHGGDFSFSASDVEDSDDEHSESSKQASSPHSSADSIVQPMRWTVDFSRARSSSSDTDDEMGDMLVSSAPSSSSSALSSPRPSALVSTVFNVDREKYSDSVLSPGRSIGSSPVSPLGSPPESPLSSSGVVLPTAVNDISAGFARTIDTPATDALETSKSTDDMAHQPTPAVDHEISCKSKLDPFITSNTSSDLHPQYRQDTFIQPLGLSVEEPSPTPLPQSHQDKFIQTSGLSVEVPPPPPLPQSNQDTFIQPSGFSVEVPPPPPLPQSNQDTFIQPSGFSVEVPPPPPLPQSNQDTSSAGFSAEEPPPPPLPPLQWRLIRKVRSAFSSSSIAPPVPQFPPAIPNKIEEESDRPPVSFAKSNSHIGQQQTPESVLQEQDSKVPQYLPEISKVAFMDSKDSTTGTSAGHSVDASIERHHTSVARDKELQVPCSIPFIDGNQAYWSSPSMKKPPVTAVEPTVAHLSSMSTAEVLENVKVSVKTSDEPGPSLDLDLTPLDGENTVAPNEPAAGTCIGDNKDSPEEKSRGVLSDQLSETSETVSLHDEYDFRSPGGDEHSTQKSSLVHSEDLKPSVKAPVDQKLVDKMSNGKQLEKVSQLQPSKDLHKNRMENALQKGTAESSNEISTVHDSVSDTLEAVKKYDNHNIKEDYPSQGKVDEPTQSFPHSNMSTAASPKKTDESANKSLVSEAELQDASMSNENIIEESRPKFLSKFERKDSLIQAIATHDRSSLKKVPDRTQSSRAEPVDDRGVLLEQIRNRSFSLRHTKVEKQPAPRPVTNINVAAILEKANAIRQAFAGSDEDEDDDDWSDD